MVQLGPGDVDRLVKQCLEQAFHGVFPEADRYFGEGSRSCRSLRLYEPGGRPDKELKGGKLETGHRGGGAEDVEGMDGPSSLQTGWWRTTPSTRPTWTAWT